MGNTGIEGMIMAGGMAQQQSQWQQMGMAAQAQNVGFFSGIDLMRAKYGYESMSETLNPKKESKPKEQSMLKEVREDFRAFMREHKSMIYWGVLLYVVDHYCFEGAFKARLQQIVHNLVGKVEKKLEEAKL